MHVLPVLSLAHSLAAHQTDGFCQANGCVPMNNPAPYDGLEPIFDGRFIRLPFFKDVVFPGTFVLFDGGNTFGNNAVGYISTSTPDGVILNAFQAPEEHDNLGPLNDPNLDDLHEVSLFTS